MLAMADLHASRQRQRHCMPQRRLRLLLLNAIAFPLQRKFGAVGWGSGRGARPLTHRAAREARRGGRGCAAEDGRGRVGRPRGNIAVDAVAGEDTVAADVSARGGTPDVVPVHGAQAVLVKLAAATAAAGTCSRVGCVNATALPASTEKTWRRGGLAAGRQCQGCPGGSDDDWRRRGQWTTTTAGHSSPQRSRQRRRRYRRPDGSDTATTISENGKGGGDGSGWCLFPPLL